MPCSTGWIASDVQHNHGATRRRCACPERWRGTARLALGKRWPQSSLVCQQGGVAARRTTGASTARLQIWKTSLEGTNAKDLGVIADDWIERYKEPARPGAYVATRIEAGQPTRIVAARPGLTRLALVAWRENVEGVERKPAAEIAATLKEAGIAWEKESTDLLERLPGLPVQDEADWKARLAFLDYQSTTKLHLQGTGDPQIAKVIGAAEALGAGASLDQALRAGAVTLESWRKADGKFQEVARVATRRLDGVPLSWLEAR